MKGKIVKSLPSDLQKFGSPPLLTLGPSSSYGPPRPVWKQHLCCIAAGDQGPLPSCTGLTTAPQFLPGRLLIIL